MYPRCTHDVPYYYTCKRTRFFPRPGARSGGGGGGGGGAPPAVTECKWSWKHMRRRCVEPPPSPPPPPPTWFAWAAARLHAAWAGWWATWYDVWLPATAKVCALNAVAIVSVVLILRAADAHR